MFSVFKFAGLGGKDNCLLEGGKENLGCLDPAVYRRPR